MLSLNFPKGHIEAINGPCQSPGWFTIDTTKKEIEVQLDLQRKPAGNMPHGFSSNR